MAKSEKRPSYFPSTPVRYTVNVPQKSRALICTGKVLCVVGVPDPDSAAVLQRAVVALRAHPNGIEGSRRRLHLLFAFDVGLYSDGFPAVVQAGTHRSHSGVSGRLADVKNARHHVGHAAGNIVLLALLLVGLQVGFVQHRLARL